MKTIKGISSIMGMIILLSFWTIEQTFTSRVYAELDFTKAFLYQGANLNRIAFPIGGMGAGMYCLEGTGAISHVSVKNQMDFFNEPCCFAAINVLGETPEKNVVRLVEGPLPDWKYFGKAESGLGSGGTTYGFPRFTGCTFQSRFPFATVRLKDSAIPVEASILAWSPFTPPDANSSGLPAGALEYTFRNTTNGPLRCIFSFGSRNFINRNGSIGPIDGGFVLYDQVGNNRENQGAFAFFVEGERNVVVDHCWFRGGWWDPFTIAWDNIDKGRLIDNPPVASNAPGATLCLPLELAPGESKTIRLSTCWYWKHSDMNFGRPDSDPFINAFKSRPSKGTAPSQQQVSGFLGRGLVNTFDPHGDRQQGVLVSPEIKLDKKYMHLLVGGGDPCTVELQVEGKSVRSASGGNTEQLRWISWDLEGIRDKAARVRLTDAVSGVWGHLLCDHIILSDESIEALKTGVENNIVDDPKRVRLIADFEQDDYRCWTVENTPDQEKAKSADPPKVDATPGDPSIMICGEGRPPMTYSPWYASRFDSIHDLAAHWLKSVDDLKTRSESFSKAFFDTTLPEEVVESIEANLTILKSPTVLRQHDGRLWCWEGCRDIGGSCYGSCTHVWNYAQAICHLFPDMERSLRQTEYFESSSEGTGKQAFRANLPISPGGSAFDAADGQLGGIMKVYREWRIFGNDDWLKLYWPRIRSSLDYMIRKWDPRHTGLLEEGHHNTYDINYFGPDGHCSSFYLGALLAACKMGDHLQDDVSFYRELYIKGTTQMVDHLYNGEYFIQIVQKEGLTRNFKPIDSNGQSAGYRAIVETVNFQGPKYQYGAGCLSDGVLGFWIARCCGIEDDILPSEMVTSHLLAVYKYNLRQDLSGHANPQRPAFAMGNDGGLLLCTWPLGGKPMLPFVYSDEVWTGIEYQVASHLMMSGHVDKGLDIVRLIRKRHDGIRRNPYNEYECGHWYARAMASYGMLQGLTGVRYDALTKTLFVDSRIGDFRSFLATATGYGTVVLKNGEASLEVVSGEIPVKKIVINAH